MPNPAESAPAAAAAVTRVYEGGWRRRMDGWTDGWMDGWTDGWIDGDTSNTPSKMLAKKQSKKLMNDTDDRRSGAPALQAPA